MENEESYYYSHKCQIENCNGKLLVKIPASKIAESQKPGKILTIQMLCPECEHENIFDFRDLEKPLSIAELKTALIFEKHKPNIKMRWENG